MKKLFLALFLFPAIIDAQVPQARFDSLAAHTAALESGVAKMAQYLQWLYNTQMPGVTARITALENRPQVTPSSGAIGAHVIGDLQVDGRICIRGTCEGSPTDFLLQIHGGYDANILLSSNENGQNGQGAHRHVSVVSGSADGGARLLHNWTCINGVCDWIEPEKSRDILAFDSQGTLSYSHDIYPNIEHAQTFIFKFDTINNRIGFASMKPGYVFGVWESTCLNCTDIFIPYQH